MSWVTRSLRRILTRGRKLTEEQHDDIVTNEDYIEQKLITKQSSSESKPVFRFPLIPDEEINGGLQARHAFDEEYEEYEPIPLFENERWPGEGEIINVHRAGSENKYVIDSDSQDDFNTPKVYSDIDRNRLREQVLNRTKSFTPTPVPSPVYGFRREEARKQVLTTEEILAKVQAAPQKDENTAKNVDSYTEWESQQSSKPFDENSEIKSIESDETGTITEHEIVSKNVAPPNETSDESNVFEEMTESHSVVEEEKAVTESKEALSHVQPEGHQDTEDDVRSGDEESELENSPTSSSVNDNPVQEKKEKVLPFNVLMLQSDKEKLKKNSLKTDQKRVEFKTEEPITRDVEEETIPYRFPPIQTLIKPEQEIRDHEWLESQSEKLVEALSHFSVQANIVHVAQGPTVTRFELTVGHGTKVSKIRNLTDDLKLALAAEDIRIQAPIPGKSSIGIEIPNRKTRAVRISEIITSETFRSSTSPLEAVLGLSLTGKPTTIDLRKMPHGLIAGATGSGKSVCINSILVSLLFKAAPSDLKLLLIDPKMVELAPFNGIPHLISPVVTDVKAATAALKWAVGEMERRYELLAHTGVRDIEGYNKKVTESRKFSLKMPYLLIVIDELADLMMMAPADVEESICRIAQKARACGIHLLIATQRPSVDVITGLIKANVPTRIAFSVSSQIDSRTIIDTPGAERLLGKGDMLYVGNGKSEPERLQGTFVTDDEIERIIEHVANEAEPEYLFGQDDLLARALEEEETDHLFDEACRFVYEQGSASTSLLQRHFSIGYNRAARLIDSMEKKGFISGQKGSKARDVFLTERDLENMSVSVE